MIKTITGIVVKGQEHGRTLGFPTANIVLPKDTIFDGVYKINILIGKRILPGIGCARNKLNQFESHIFDFNEGIYDREIGVVVLDKIRDLRDYSSKSELKEQIKKDIQEVKNIKNYVLTFGTFDLIHEGHKYFLREAKKYGDALVTILATDKSIEKFKHHEPLYNIETRKKQLQNLKIIDIIGVGDENNPLKWIEMYSPKVICLGYDQIGYSAELKEYIKNSQIPIDVIRIEAFMEDKYKSSLLKEKLKQ